VWLGVIWACSSGSKGSSNPGMTGVNGGDAGVGGAVARGGGAGVNGLSGTSQAESGAGGEDNGTSPGGNGGIANAGRDGAAANGGVRTTGGSSGDSGEAGSEAGSGGETFEPIDVPGYLNGSRLRARVVVGADGSRHFRAFHDTRLAVDCHFEVVQGDGFRCVPINGANVQSEAFVDDQCAIPGVGHEIACGKAPRFITRGTSVVASCEGFAPQRVTELGMEYPDGYSMLGCALEDAGGLNAWYATTAVDPTTFVAAVLERVALGDGLFVERFRAEDGALRTHRLWFDGLGCREVAITGAGSRCVPLPPLPFVIAFFANDTCTERVGLMQLGEGCDVPPYAAVREADPEDSCAPALMKLHHLGSMNEMSVFRDISGQCTAADIGPPLSLRRVRLRGAADPDVLPALEVEHVGSGRLRTRSIATESGSTVTIGSQIYDTVLDEPCQPQAFEDGSVRCVPSFGVVSGAYYADDQCTVPLQESYGCPPAGYVTLPAQASACSSEPVTRVIPGILKPGAAHVGTVYSLEQGTCSPATPDVTARFALLEPVPTATFETLTEELELP
jgi:hypothetical protein